MESTYEQKIEALIPIAVRAADSTVRGTTFPQEGYDEAVAEKWNKIYHDTMDRLAALNGIRRTTRPGCH